MCQVVVKPLVWDRAMVKLPGWVLRTMVKLSVGLDAAVVKLLGEWFQVVGWC